MLGCVLALALMCNPGDNDQVQVPAGVYMHQLIEVRKCSLWLHHRFWVECQIDAHENCDPTDLIDVDVRRWIWMTQTLTNNPDRHLTLLQRFRKLVSR